MINNDLYFTFIKSKAKFIIITIKIELKTKITDESRFI